MPDVATFAVDDGFAYSVPSTLTGVDVGSIVRVPLGGRKVRGYVTAVEVSAPKRPLRPIAATSGSTTVFDDALLRTARWAAAHYVSPLSTILGATAPPNLPRLVPHPAGSDSTGTPRRAEPHRRSRYEVTGRGYAEHVRRLADPILSSGRNVLVVVPTAADCESLAGILVESLGARVVAATSALGGREETSAWSALRLHGGLVAVGTRQIAWWHGGDVGLGIVIEEGRPAMKAKQTPTWHVRDVLKRRAAVERFPLTFLGPVPTVETLAAGVEIHEPAGRVWPVVEVAPRDEDPPGTGAVLSKTRASLTGIVAAGGSAFVLVPHRGYAAAMACVVCGTIRRCARCGAAVGSSGPCPRCEAPVGGECSCGAARFRPLGAGVGRVVDELRRSLGSAVTSAGGRGSVEVGTERDLVAVGTVDLVVAIDLDGTILAPTYRAGEDALRLGARLALKVPPGRGRRCLVQTSIAAHPVIVALRSGRPIPFLHSELSERERLRLPPVGDLVAFEVRGGDVATVDSDLRAISGDALVRGPAPTDTGARWLLQSGDLGPTKVRMRALVQSLRDHSVTVRVDADPVSL